jgi:hypothetical protein
MCISTLLEYAIEYRGYLNVVLRSEWFKYYLFVYNQCYDYDNKFPVCWYYTRQGHKIFINKNLKMRWHYKRFYDIIESSKLIDSILQGLMSHS